MKLAGPICFCIAFLLGQTALADAALRPVVVELFTSEGCSSCPPADAFLRDLAKRDDVLALSFHVDYWDALGWKDMLASHAFTMRQRAYSAAMRLRGVYTPQMVIDGAAEGIGSHRAEINAKIKDREEKLSAVPMETAEKAGAMSLKIGAGATPASPATIWLLRYVPSQSVAIKRGENAGKAITYVNAVRDMRSIGVWDGRAIELPLPKLEDGRYVALLQTGKTGAMLGAARIGR